MQEGVPRAVLVIHPGSGEFVFPIHWMTLVAPPFRCWGPHWLRRRRGPPANAADAIEEAIGAGIGLIVCVMERIPVLDMVRVRS